MKVIKLSDFVGVQLQNAQLHRQGLFELERAEHKRCVAVEARFLQRKRDVKQARRSRMWLRYLSGWSLLQLMPRVSIPAQPSLLQPGEVENRWKAGAEGEERFLDLMGKQLSNDWTAICGYRNQKGEIDVILVGPQGAVAVEIKNYFGRIRCSGDTFWRTARGEDKRMEDRGSRSPSQQVNQATDELQRSLGLHKVARAVVFTHRGAYVQSVNSPTVEYVGVLTDFRPADLPASEPQHWDEARRQSTLDSLAEDHRRHNQHRPTLTASRLPSFVTVRSLMSEYRRALAAVCVFCLVCFCVGAATLVRRAAGPTHSSAPIVEGTQPSGKIAADGVPRALQQAVGEWASRRKALRRLDRFVIVAMQPQGTATSSSALVVTTSWQRANVAGSTRLLLHVSQHRGRWRIDTVRNMEGSELRLP